MDEKSFKSLIYIIIAVVVGIIVGAGFTSLINQGFSPKGGSISMFPPVYHGQDWLVKVDNYVITKKDFENYYKLNIAQIPASQLASVSEGVLKKTLLDNLLGEYIINLKAINDGTIDKASATEALRQAIFSIYMNKYSPQDKSIFVPSSDEINEFYQQHKAQIDPRMTADEITSYLKQFLSQQNYQKWANDFINASKSSYRIVSNSDLLREEGVSETSQTSQGEMTPSPINSISNITTK